MYKFANKKIVIMRTVATVAVCFALISICFAGFFIVFCRSKVNGNSMEPTLNAQFSINGKQDVIYINRFADVKRGDIVVIDATKHSTFGNYIIKRLIAVEGDIVNMIYDNTVRQYKVIVNNEVVDSRPYQDFGYNTYDNFYAYINNVDESRKTENGLIIGKGEIFVLGDNWDNSKDSALVGAFKSKDIVGKVEIIARPNQNEFIEVLKRIF